jgi:hypothetical protein
LHCRAELDDACSHGSHPYELTDLGIDADVVREKFALPTSPRTTRTVDWGYGSSAIGSRVYRAVAAVRVCPSTCGRRPQPAATVRRRPPGSVLNVLTSRGRRFEPASAHRCSSLLEMGHGPENAGGHRAFIARVVRVVRGPQDVSRCLRARTRTPACYAGGHRALIRHICDEFDDVPTVDPSTKGARGDGGLRRLASVSVGWCSFLRVVQAAVVMQHQRTQRRRHRRFAWLSPALLPL